MIDKTAKKVGTVTGVFRTREDAEKAYESLIRRGYSRDEITVLMSDKTRDTHFKNSEVIHDEGNKSMEKAGVGSAIGGSIGGIVGAIAAIGTSIALPGIGLIIAGPILAGLAGAGAGGLTGGLIGGLIGAGIPKERAEIYDRSIQKGGVVLGITPKNDSDSQAITEDWKTYRGEEIYGPDRQSAVL
ncbi:MAG: hypothetical protein HC819_04300 [Cyclobacteriaceae bacterium]|nr:hypothetical protein [Cyclobacteriaceae bacterium]